jgi:hypothetical protein
LKAKRNRDFHRRRSWAPAIRSCASGSQADFGTGLLLPRNVFWEEDGGSVGSIAHPTKLTISAVASQSCRRQKHGSRQSACAASRGLDLARDRPS